MATKNPTPGPFKPHLRKNQILFNARNTWQVLWRDTTTGQLYRPSEIAWMTRSTTRGRQATDWAARINARIIANCARRYQP